MNALTRFAAPAILAFAAFGAHAATGTASSAAFVGQNEAGPIPNPHYVAPARVEATTPQYIGQNEAGLIRNPAFEAEVQRADSRTNPEPVGRARRDIYVG